VLCVLGLYLEVSWLFDCVAGVLLLCWCCFSGCCVYAISVCFKWRVVSCLVVLVACLWDLGLVV